MPIKIKKKKTLQIEWNPIGKDYFKPMKDDNSKLQQIIITNKINLKNGVGNEKQKTHLGI